MSRSLILFSSFSIFLSFVSTLHAQDDRQTNFLKSADDDERKFTNIGNIGLTVSNFGTFGTRNAYWPNQPSCEYPRGSRVEHIYQGGLWVGARVRSTGELFVTTGASDRTRRPGRTDPSLLGYEFTNEAGAGIVQRSSLPFSASFTPRAVSHQDFVSEYSDLNRRVPATGDTIAEHVPLRIQVSQDAYAWNFPFADAFTIVKYTIRNVGSENLDSIYVGLWSEMVVHNTNLVRPGIGSIYFNHSGHGYDSLQRMTYAFDYDGQPAPPTADSYVGIKLLGTSPFPLNVDSLGDLYKKTFFNAWRFQETSSGSPDYFSPCKDSPTSAAIENCPSSSRTRYERLSSSLTPTRIAELRTSSFLDVPNTLLSVGPLTGDSLGYRKSVLSPGDSLTVVFGIVCARKFGTGNTNLDTPEQRFQLYFNSAWAQRAYNGEDLNGNNQLDPGEDIVERNDSLGLIYQADGKLTRFLLPFPPRQPKVRAEIENQNVVIYWDKFTAEESIDPISGVRDFEGYRIYRSNAGADFISPETILLNLQLVGDFDKGENSVGNNTGLGRISLDSAKVFPGDTVAYWYRFPPRECDTVRNPLGQIDTVLCNWISITHLNGWQYIYGVSAYDQGDSVNGLPSLESAKVLTRVVPGTLPASAASAEVKVYPNPYYASAIWDGSGERNRKIYFTNLPAKCQIRIYTLAGDIVGQLDHDASTYTGSDIQWFQTHGDPQTTPQFSGGEHAWDLISRFDQAIATGLYLFTVRDDITGDIKRGKFLVIK